MSPRREPAKPDDEDATEGAPRVDDAFAGLTPIDVIEGELVPRARRR
ncbi:MULTISPECIES: hypothetical protein [Microbacterium]|nr:MULTISPECIES: hypothetical protein [Microbacterium]MCK6068333.1 hypothetical protein [Microbacterium sp. EYE_512]